MASIVAQRMVRALIRLGWAVHRVTGSHYVLVKQGRTPIIIPVHKGKTLKEGTARAILKEAGETEEEFFSVY